MKRLLLPFLLILWITPSKAQSVGVKEKGISFNISEVDRKVDVLFDNIFFTSYIYPASLEKPVLYPVTTSTGTIVTRGFPLIPRANERIDHPHQVGWWFNYGDVNGLDFWNNSYAIPDSMKPHYGSIRHVSVLKAEGGEEKGILIVVCNWVNQRNEVLLREETTFIFTGDAIRRRIVRETKLTAVNGDVRFGDNKEGLCAIRVDRAFESPADKPEIFTDASGNATVVPVLNNEGVNGVYRSSEGKEKDDVWGTRAEWVSLSAKKNSEEISICLFDNPKNPGAPAYWHARGYGLFSANDLGHKAFNPSAAENITMLPSGKSILFKHMLLIKTAGFITDEELKAESEQFAKQ